MSDDLTKVHVELPNHWGTGGESLWARPLGDDLYQLDNVPFYAYGLNYGDVVRATEDAPNLKPEIREVARPSGHQTIRVFFETGVAEGTMMALLATLKPLAVSFERATERFFALDLEPHVDLMTIRGVLDDWERKGAASYETCEARIPGSFDDAPQLQNDGHEGPEAP